MKNSFGSSVILTLFGESHGAGIGAVLDGLAPGITVDEDFIRSQLSLRRPVGDISTPRAEPDNFVIESGVFGGKVLQRAALKGAPGSRGLCGVHKIPRL